MDMTPERWSQTAAYLADVFGRPDEQLRTLMSRAIAAGLPDIAVSADVGRFLTLMTSLTGGGLGAGLAIEVGTLAGYSGIWLARGLRAGGRLITIELESAHADFAQAEFKRAHLADRIQIRRGRALDVLAALSNELPLASVDMVFLDAVKTEYCAYFHLIKPMLRPGGVLIADNALGSNSWWITDAAESSPERDAVDHFNHLVAGDPDLDPAAITNRQGLLVARKLH